MWWLSFRSTDRNVRKVGRPVWGSRPLYDMGFFFTSSMNIFVNIGLDHVPKMRPAHDGDLSETQPE